VILIFRDIFSALMVPGRVKRRLRFVPVYFHATWTLWAAAGRRINSEDRRERLLSIYGPLAMLCLLAFWAAGLLLAFSLLQIGLTQSRRPSDFLDALYASGARIFTLGTEESTNSPAIVKALVIVEGGTGLGFVTMVITYLPVLYQLYSRRETHIILMDERAGEPVSAGSLICNHARRNAIYRLDTLLAAWEQWSAELLESHVSYPMLSYYRSQHSDQSWLAAMAVIMDTCALRMAGAGGFDQFQAERTFAMSTSAMRNISEILRVQPMECYDSRLSQDTFYELIAQLQQNELPVGDADVWSRLSEIRDGYEPLLAAMADYFVIELPAWLSSPCQRNEPSPASRSMDIAS